MDCKNTVFLFRWNKERKKFQDLAVSRQQSAISSIQTLLIADC
jgi:hypothetical protein